MKNRNTKTSTLIKWAHFQKTLFLVLCLNLFLNSNVFCENNADTLKAPKKNLIYIELGGSAIGYSLNYERNFVRRNGFSFSGRMGASSYFFLPADRDNVGAIFMPIETIFSYGKKYHHIELGVGGLFGVNFTQTDIFDVFEINPIPETHVAYKYLRNKFLFKFSIVEFISPKLNYVGFWPGISFGYSF